MTTAVGPEKTARTLGDLIDRLGGISAGRILLEPPPGHATEGDLIAVHHREGRVCELVDGTLVEKAMGLRESILAGALLALLRGFVVPRNLGIVSGEAGSLRLMAGLVRIPDVAFISWDRIPERRIPAEPVPHLAPDLAIEVLSAGNTEREMLRKRREYFEAGVRLVWMVDPEARTLTVYTAVQRATLFDQTQVLDGGDVLPGFSLSLQELFAELDRQGKDE